MRQVALACIVGLLASFPIQARAQFAPPQLPRGAVELGLVNEWFHRDFEPSAFADAEWSIGSLWLTYGAFDWLTLQGQGGTFSVDHDDFPESNYHRYTLGLGSAVRLYSSGPWSISASVRYIDTFDRDYSAQQFDKGVDTFSGALQATRSFVLWKQAAQVWIAPVFSDDDADAYLWGAHEPIEATTGLGWGAGAGAHVVVGGFLAFFGYASYIDYATGGVGFALHAGKGSF